MTEHPPRWWLRMPFCRVVGPGAPSGTSRQCLTGPASKKAPLREARQSPPFPSYCHNHSPRPEITPSSAFLCFLRKLQSFLLRAGLLYDGFDCLLKTATLTSVAWIQNPINYNAFRLKRTLFRKSTLPVPSM